MGKRWTEEELKLVTDFYPHIATILIADELQRPIGQVYQAAARMGVEKTEEFIREDCRERMRRADHGGKAHQFKKGQEPPNKGLKRPGWAPGRMSETQFKKGNHPHTWKPVGSKRTTDEGYLQRKVSDTGDTTKDWRSVHVLVWERWRGPVPKGSVVVFKDGDPGNVKLKNLECLTRKELMLRNSSQRWGPEVFELIQLRGAVNRQIRRRLGKE